MAVRHDDGDILASSATIVASGAHLVLRGPSGIGKTTLLRTMLAAQVQSRTPNRVIRAVASATARRVPLGALAAHFPPEVMGARTAAERLAAAAVHLRALPERPLLVIDDAHDLDDESASFVHHLVTTGSVQLVAAVNVDFWIPEVFARMQANGDVEVIDVQPMSPDRVRGLVAERVRGIVEADTATLFHEASEGNPLLVVELVRANLASGRLSNVDGMWIARSIEWVPSLSESLTTRVLGWPTHVREVATILAVAGPLPAAVVRSVVPGDGADQAVAEGAVREGTDGVLGLGHPMLARTVLAGVDDARRSDVLGRVVDCVLTGDISSAGEWVTIATWLAELAEHRRLDRALVLDVADRMITALRPDLCERLILASGLDTAESRLWLGRSAALQGRAAPSDDVDLDAAKTASEAFMLGFGAEDEVRTVLRRAAMTLTGEAGATARSIELSILLCTGGPIEPISAELLLLVRDRRGSEAAHAAGIVSVAGLMAVGRFDDALGVADELREHGVEGNEFRRQQLALNTTEAFHRSGRRAEAVAARAQHFPLGGSSPLPIARAYDAALGAQFDMADGCPLPAMEHFGRIIAMTGGIDAGGILAWARAACG